MEPIEMWLFTLSNENCAVGLYETRLQYLCMISKKHIARNKVHLH